MNNLYISNKSLNAPIYSFWAIGGSRKFCQRGSNAENLFFVVLVDEGTEDEAFFFILAPCRLMHRGNMVRSSGNILVPRHAVFLIFCTNSTVLLT